MKQNHGFTLVEFLLYTGLLMIILTILSTMFTSITDIQLESESSTALNHDESFIVNRLSYDIRRATGILLPASTGVSGSTLQITVGGVTHQYTVTGGNLLLTAGANNYRLNGEGTTVQSASFQRLGNPGGFHTIRYTIVISSSSVSPGDIAPPQRILSATVALR